MKRALEVQVAQLCDGGVLIVRDFVDPGPGEVLLDLRDDDGHDDDAQPLTCSTAALFRRFSRDFRLLQPAEKRGFHFVEQPPPRTGWRRFSLSRTLAAEFVLRKDYRNDWELEAQEEYTYATQTEMEAMFAGLGLRVLASTPIWNPWIVRNRFDGKIEIRSTAGVLGRWAAMRTTSSRSDRPTLMSFTNPSASAMSPKNALCGVTVSPMRRRPGCRSR